MLEAAVLAEADALQQVFGSPGHGAERATSLDWRPGCSNSGATIPGTRARGLGAPTPPRHDPRMDSETATAPAPITTPYSEATAQVLSLLRSARTKVPAEL